jgi:tetratricopeptide (TPR) repeat protein
MTEQRNIFDQQATVSKDAPPQYKENCGREEFDSFINNPEYQKLLTSYQNAEWESCKKILGSLLEAYPGNARLFDLKQDIEIQLEFHQFDLDIARSRRIGRIGRAAGTLLIVCVGLVLGYYGFQLFTSTNFSQFTELLYPKAEVQATQDIMGNLAELENQAMALLQNGNAVSALQIIQQIETVDPNYPDLALLKEKINKLADYNLLYEQAMQDLSANQPVEALSLFKQIQQEYPVFRDVEYQIQKIEKSNLIQELLTKANDAFQAGEWTVVIDSYEQVSVIDPTLNVPNLEEQLFVSYYHAITDILNQAQTTQEDMVNAEDYYRKAFSLVPQNPNFTQERTDLVNLMNDLMILKYRQNAKTLLDSLDASEASVTLAVSYLKKASNLAPDNHDLKNEYDNAQAYQVALQHFNDKDWDSAIQYLENLANFNSSYANGMLNTLLYEAYTARGSRYMSIGFYDDARRDFAQAEVIAWGQTPPNSMQMLQAELNLGFIVGKRYEYKDSASYFVNGLDYINAMARISDPQILNSLVSARQLYDTGQYKDAYDLFAEILNDPTTFCTIQEISASKGDSLAHLAAVYSSTIKAIIDENNLATIMAETVLLETDQVLKVPSIP